MIELPELPRPAWTGMLIEGQPPYQHFTAEQIEAHGRACARAAMERAAQIADKIEAERWAAYKDRNSTHAGSDYVQGQSDGATLIAAAIRAEIEKEEGK